MKTMRKPTTSTTLPGGTFKRADDLILTRVGYGAMQLAGPHVFGPPADHDGALWLRGPSWQISRVSFASDKRLAVRSRAIRWLDHPAREKSLVLLGEILVETVDQADERYAKGA